MKKTYLLLLTLALTACSVPESSIVAPSSALPPISEASDQTETPSSEDNTTDKESSLSSEAVSSENTSESSLSEESHLSSDERSESSISSEETELSSPSSETEETSSETNPDGSRVLTTPENTVPLAWSQTESVYDFTESFPDDFSYIYGNQKVDYPQFYQSQKDGNLQLGGWKITFPNTGARKGFQTPFFVTDKKIEIRLYIGDVNNNNDKVDEDTPFLTIYGFDHDGNRIRTTTMDCPDNFYNYRGKDNPYVKIYMNGNGLSYLELRFTAAPYKSSQCYNFGVRKVGFKTFPYELN